MGWIFWIVVGILAGWLAEKIMKTDLSLVMNFVVGIAGAFIGGAIIQYLTPFSDDGGFVWSTLVATLGAVVLLWIVSLLKKRGVVS